MNLNINKWKRFYLGRLFVIKKGKRLTSDDQEEGNNPYIGAIDSNNGVANYIGQTPIHEANTITLSYNGSVGEAFYQPKPYWATDDVNALYAKYDNFNEAIGLFIVAIIKKEKYRFSYGRKWTLNNMAITDICLPIQHNPDGTPFIDDTHKYSDDGYVPDWQFMEEYIKSLHYKPLTTKNKSGNVPDLNVQYWKDFLLTEIFTTLEPGKISNASDLEEGQDLPYIGAKKNDNGVMQMCADVPELRSKGNCVVMICDGEGSVGLANYMESDFLGTVNLMLGYNDAHLNAYTGLFLATILSQERPKYSFGRKWKTHIPETTIKLPVDSNGEPDWQFMENYIKALPYGDRL